MRLVCTSFLLCLALLSPAAHTAPAPVFLEEMTWTEVRDALAAGTTTVIIPVGGTEQNGAHMALGKHNARAKALAGRIASALGNALVAPVLSYTPEGNIAPPAGHMRYPGTISISDAAFQGVLDGAARSFKQHGFRHIVWLGDSGNYLSLIANVAQRLNGEWAGTPTRAHFIAEYYRTGQAEYVAALRAKGLSDAQIGSHAGAADTSLLLALDATMVRDERIAPGTYTANTDGVAGDPRVASAALGQLGVDLIVARSVAAIRRATAAPGNGAAPR